MIEKIEAHSFLSTPASHEEMYDGWLLRRAGGRTKRFNSVNFPSASMGDIPIEEKLDYCEQFYAAANMPCRFRITPLATPSNLQGLLLDRGYQRVDSTDVCSRTLSDLPNSPADNVVISDQMSEEWTDKLCELTDRDNDQREAFVQMKSRLEIEHLFASIVQNSRIISVGFTTIHDGIMGLFEFATDPEFRRQGHAGFIVDSLLSHAKSQGVTAAYLQVVQNNSGGLKFWKNMGFAKTEYEYSYLCKDVIS